MKTSHWHGPVKVTATSGGGGVGRVLSLLAALVLALAVLAIALVVRWDIVVPALLGTLVLGYIVRERVAEARLDALAERTEHTYQRRQAEKRREAAQQGAPRALPPAPPRALPAPAVVGHAVDHPDHAEEAQR